MIKQAVILAGGLGRRIQSMADGKPKALIPVAGRPFIEHQFELLTHCGIQNVVLCVGYMGDQIEHHVQDGAQFGLRVQYACENAAGLLGTGGALVNALPLLQEYFMVIYGDSYLPVDYTAFAQAFEQCRCPAMMSVFRNAGQWDHSNTRIANGLVSFYDKAAPHGAADYIDYGLTAFQRQEIEIYRNHKPPLEMAGRLTGLVARNALAAWEAPRRFYEIGKPEGLRELEKLLTTDHANFTTPAATRASTLQPAIFLDRDGILNEMIYDETHGLLDSPHRPEQVRLIPGAAEFMLRAQALGYKLIVVTNQPGIAKGILTFPELEAINQRLAELLAAAGAKWDALYFCPHHPRGDGHTDNPYVQECDCRKPKPGLLLRAAAEMQLALANSWMLGDGLNDIQAGNAAGCYSVLLTHVKIEQVERFFDLPHACPSLVVPDLTTAGSHLQQAASPDRTVQAP